jgi:hypothetical protein
MSVNLSEFTTEQLQVLLNLVVLKITEENNHRKEWLKYFSIPGADIPDGYYMNQPEKAKEMETLALWRVQILNSIVEVSQKETMQSN